MKFYFFENIYFGKNEKEENIFEKFFWKLFENKMRRKLPNLSNKMNRQLSKLEQSPATVPKTWCTKLWSQATAPKTMYARLNKLFFIHNFDTTNQQVHWVVQVINLTWVRVDPTEIVGLKQAMVTL